MSSDLASNSQSISEETEKLNDTNVSKRKLHQCPDCEYSTPDLYRYKRHRASSKHNNGLEESHKTFVCEICKAEGKHYQTQHSTHFKTHLENHKSLPDIACTQANCTFMFKTQSALVKHLNSFHSEVEFKCSYANCSFTSKYKANLTKHVKQKHPT